MLDTLEEKDNYSRAKELKDAASNWVDREFNQIQLEVYEKVNEYLFEIIRQEPPESLVYDYFHSLTAEQVRDLKKEIADVNTDIESEGLTPFEVTEEEIQEYLVEHREDDIREYHLESGADQNYPMWNTLFEFKSEPPAEWLTKAQSIGLGVIEEQDVFNSTLFASSCGHSFYSAYWIPLYLSIFRSEQDKYANIDFSMV